MERGRAVLKAITAGHGSAANVYLGSDGADTGHGLCLYDVLDVL